MSALSLFRSGAMAAVLTAACIAAATPAFADPGYTQDNRVSLLLRNESGCTVSADFIRAGKREFGVTIDNGRSWQSYNQGQYRLAGTARCGDKTLNVVPRDVTLEKARPQTITARRNASGEVFYQ